MGERQWFYLQQQVCVAVRIQMKDAAWHSDNARVVSLKKPTWSLTHHHCTVSFSHIFSGPRSYASRFQHSWMRGSWSSRHKDSLLSVGFALWCQTLLQRAWSLFWYSLVCLWHSEDRLSWYILIIKANTMHFPQLYFGKELYIFRTVSIIRSLNTVFTSVGSCSLADSMTKYNLFWIQC
jgi:hypothetical protein